MKPTREELTALLAKGPQWYDQNGLIEHRQPRGLGAVLANHGEVITGFVTGFFVGAVLLLVVFVGWLYFN
jgi:hypothetical protein